MGRCASLSVSMLKRMFWWTMFKGLHGVISQKIVPFKIQLESQKAAALLWRLETSFLPWRSGFNP
jgi:hypothetical protein